MDRLDKIISDVAYVYDALMAYRNIVETGNCNECQRKRECGYVPNPGRMVRYNCPFFARQRDGIAQ